MKYVVILFLIVNSCKRASSSKGTSIVKKEEASSITISKLETGIITLTNYDGDLFDSKIAVSDTLFTILEYQVGRATGFKASEGAISLWNRGVKILDTIYSVQNAEKYFRENVKHYNLKEVALDKFISNQNISIPNNSCSVIKKVKINVARGDQNTILKTKQNAIIQLYNENLNYSNLMICYNDKIFRKKIMTEDFPKGPTMNLYDINGDNKEELILFYINYGYWNSIEYFMEVYEINY